MAKLKAATRNALPKGDFALPESRKFPVNDKNHARNAKSRASEMEHKGAISSATKAKIDHAADAVLRRMHGDGAPGSHFSGH